MDDLPLPWYRQLIVRIGTMAWLKASGTMAFMAVFFWGYFTVLRHPAQPPLIMPLTPLDDWIPFSGQAFPVYVSLWVYVSLPPALIIRFRPLAWFGVWIASLCLTCLALFWAFPTAVPATAIDWASHPEMAVLKGLDASGNACPSLHVASAVFSAAWLARLFGAIGAPGLLHGLSLVHCLAILWSTLATRQHVVLDVLAGALLGGVFAWASLRHAGRLGETV